MAAITDISFSSPSSSSSNNGRRILGWRVMSVAALLASIPLGIWMIGLINRQQATPLTVVGGNPSTAKDIIPPASVTKKAELPTAQPNTPSIDQRWQEAEFKQQMALFETGWEEYFQTRKASFDRQQQRSQH